MKKLVFVVLFVVAINSVSAQIIYTKDGVALGDKNELISGCADGIGSPEIDLNGVNFNSHDLCSCLVSTVFPAMTLQEMMYLSEQDEENIMSLIPSDIYSLLMQCMYSNVTYDEDVTFDPEMFTEENIEIAVDACVESFLATDGINASRSNVEKYCRCVMDKLPESNLSVEEYMKQVQDVNSKLFNEVITPCMSFLAEDIAPIARNVYNPSDIVGEMPMSKVTLVDFLSQGYKVKIVIGGVERYFLFDTGAAELIINQTLAEELMTKGLLTEDQYVGQVNYQLADGSYVLADEVVLNNVQIGDYTVNNVVVDIIAEGGMLCGLGFLDKFKKWELDKHNKLLILYK